MPSPFLLVLALAADPTPEPLWPNGIPGGPVGVEATEPPTLTVYPAPADKRTGTAVVVCPGGGYGFLADKHEGRDVAAWLNERGVTAALLRYRVVKKGRPGPLLDAPLKDAQRAVRTVRARAKELGVDPARVGVWGFSAGGHLASTVGTHFDAGSPDAADPVERVSCRPDFLVLAYPVVTMGQATHGGSRANLLGKEPKPDLVELYSNEKRVTKDTPPTFLFHTGEDKIVVIENARLFAEACRKAGVPVELVEYEKGPHGVGLAPKIAGLSEWPAKLEAWMTGRGLLTPGKE